MTSEKPIIPMATKISIPIGKAVAVLLADQGKRVRPGQSVALRLTEIDGRRVVEIIAEPGFPYEGGQ